jgi:hypothetical protein
MRSSIVSNALGLVGAAIGGVAGYALFFWIASKGYYGMMIPGALMGLGSSLLARHRSVPRGAVVGLSALVLGVYTEWRYAPFKADQSFGFLVTHLTDTSPITLLMIGFGALFAFWMGRDANPLFWTGPTSRSGKERDA